MDAPSLEALKARQKGLGATWTSEGASAHGRGQGTR